MLFPWDELNAVRSKVEKLEIESTAEDGGKKYDAEKCIDIVYEYLEMAWTMGVENTNENLSTSYAATSPVLSAEMRSEINRKVADKDYKERIREWAEKGDFEAIIRVAETDAHRVINAASFETAKKAGARWKTWVTMNDDKVRDTHAYLHAKTIGIDEYFVTFNGDRALAPGMFGIPEQDCGCRCILTYS